MHDIGPITNTSFTFLVFATSHFPSAGSWVSKEKKRKKDVVSGGLGA